MQQPTAKQIKSAVITVLSECGILPHSYMLSSLRVSVKERGLLPKVVEVRYQTRCIETISTEFNWSEIVSHIKPVSGKPSKKAGNRLTASDQPIAGYYGVHHNIVHDF
jgi:hypothetical protein